MKKNYRKIPEFIKIRIEEIDNNNIIVGSILSLKKAEIAKPEFNNLGLSLNNNQINLIQRYIPANSLGSFSRKNIDGYKITHKDLPKISKSYYMGERPIFGDWSKGSFSLYITRKIFPYDNIPPRELSISTEILEETKNDSSLKLL